MDTPPEETIEFNPNAVFAYIQREYPDVMLDAINVTRREAMEWGEKLRAAVKKSPATTKKAAKKAAAKAKGRS